MSDFRTALCWGVGILVLIFALIIITGTFGLGWQRTTAPIREETRRITHEQSQSYQHGMAVDLDDLCRERRLASDENTKSILAETIRLRSARYSGELPQHIKECVDEVR